MSDQPQTLPPLPFVCPLCLWSWASEEGLRAHIQPTHNTTLDRFDAVMEEPTNAINYHVGVNERLTAEVERLTRELDAERHHRINLDVIAKNLTVKCDQQARALETSSRSVDDWREAWEQKQIELERAEAERDEPAAQVAALREALEASRIPHLDVEGDPFFSCPIARGGSCLRHDMDGQCPCGCNCGADEHNARIDAALAGGQGDG